MHSIRATWLLCTILVAGLWLVTPTSVLAQTEDGGFRWVVVIRHAEKATEPEKDPPLTPAGEERAELLQRFLQFSPVSGLFATELQRSEKTLAPLSESTGLTIEINDSDDPYGMAERVLRDGGTFAVVSAHSDTVLPILNGLTGGDYSDWGPVLYHDLFLVALPPEGEAQVLRFHYGETDF